MRGIAMAATLAALASTGAQAQTTDVVYEQAQVWTGSGFVRADVAVRGNRLINPAEAGAGARRTPAAGRFIVPPYANAHAHITNADMETSRVYTDAGVFYVWNPNTIVMGPAEKAFWARPDAYDVKVSQGGITEPGGHPERLYVEYLANSVYGGKPREWFIGNAFHYGATEAEIDAALDLLKSQGADFVKALLINSERYAELKDDPEAYGSKGLNPGNLTYLVRGAHARGLPVAVHVESAFDLEVAARAGEDMAAHLPGYGGDSPEDLASKRLTPEIAALVASAGMTVVPTYALIRGSAYDAETPLAEALAPQVALQRENLRLLREAGVKMAMGTDGRGPIWTEAEHWVEIGALDHAAATAVVLGTGARLFPERRIGCFEPGCEADFLILDADPTQDIRALRGIERRVMQGVELPAPPSPSEPET